MRGAPIRTWAQGVIWSIRFKTKHQVKIRVTGPKIHNYTWMTICLWSSRKFSQQILPYCWPNVEKKILCACSTFHEDLKWFSFMTKNIELWENLLTKQWEIFKKHSSSNCSQTTTRMKKLSAKCLVNILVKNSFFNIWSTFKQHNYVDQSISVSQIRYF